MKTKAAQRLWRWARLCGISVAVAGMTGCQALGTKSKDGAVATGPMIVSPPKVRKITPRKGEPNAEEMREEKWVSIARPDGTDFVVAKDGMDDVVSMYAHQSEQDASLKTLDDVERALSGNPSLKFEKLRRAEVLGVPVLRFERLEEDESGGDDRVRSALNTRGRTLATVYHVKTVGAVVMHPKLPNRFVTLGCARASHHGEMGEYESTFEDFLSAFIADNCLDQQTWH